MPLFNSPIPDYPTQTDAGDYKDNIDAAFAALAAQPEVRSITTPPLFAASFKNSLAFDGAADSHIDFIRDNTCTLLDRYGVLQISTNDEPRFEKNGLLIEEGIFNLMPRSEEFDHANWTKSGTPITTANSTDAPDGLTTADTLEDDDGAAWETYSQPGVFLLVTAIHTASLFIKKDAVARATRFPIVRLTFSGSTLEANDLAIDTSTGESSLSGIDPSISGAVIDFNSDYWRVELTAKSQDASNTTVSLEIYPAAGASAGWSYDVSATGSIIAWGAQLERLPFATSYQPTTTASSTRESEEVDLIYVDNVPATNEDISIICDVDILGNNTVDQYVINDDGVTNFWIKASDSANSNQVACNLGGTTVFAPALTPGQVTRIGVTATATTIKLFINGVLTDTETRSAQTGAYSGLHIGSKDGALEHLFGHLSNLRIYDFALTDDQMRIV